MPSNFHVWWWESCGSKTGETFHIEKPSALFSFLNINKEKKSKTQITYHRFLLWPLQHNSVKTKNKTVYYEEILECQHSIFWLESWRRVHCHTAKLELYRSVTIHQVNLKDKNGYCNGLVIFRYITFSILQLLLLWTDGNYYTSTHSSCTLLQISLSRIQIHGSLWKASWSI
jgi:hypothetical protein